MGIPGPGGPCSEIYIDRGAEYGPDGGPIVDEDRFLEIWNLVFMQEELSAVRAKDDFDVVRPLPRPNIDTGMGLERVAYLLQGVDNLYEIDEVYPVIERAAELAGKRYGADHGDDVRLRVVADHVRSALMLIGDGVTPGNEARGYVLRRLLRRVVRSMRLLGMDAPSFGELFPVSRDAMQGSYPEVATDFARISDIAYAEEEAFRGTLTQGTHLFDLAVSKARSESASILSGDRAFQLHDTYGFPIELTLEMAGEQGLEVDEAGFRTLMQEQRDRAKADARSKKGSGVNTEVYTRLRAEGETPFTGFETLAQETAVRGIVVDGELREVALPGEQVEIVLTETPFYAESGGQSGDHGEIVTSDGLRLQVFDVQRPVKGLVVHKVTVGEGELRTGQTVQAVVDGDWRLGACQAHSATHVIHEALHEILGPTALQAGSFNRPGYMRLDFRWNHGVTEDQKAKIEQLCNEAIRADLGVSATLMPLAEARASGAIGLFGEVYGEVVRVVDMGDGWSRELCAGTHVAQSAQVGLLAVNAESSVGSGIRRVEAFVGMEAFQHLAKERSLVMGLADSLKVQPDQVARPGGADGGAAEGGGAGDRVAEVGEPARRGRADPGQGARHVGRLLHRAPRRRRDRQRPALAGHRGARSGHRPGGRGLHRRRHAGQAGRGDRDHRRCPAPRTERRRAGQGRDGGARRTRRRQGRPGPGRRHQRRRRGPGPDRRRARHRRQGHPVVGSADCG